MTPTPAPAATPRRGRLFTRAFVIVGLATLAYFVADGVMFVVLPVYVERGLGGDKVAVGVAYGAFALTAILLRSWAGATSDRRGRKPLLLAGLVLFAIGSLGHLVAVNLPLVIVMRLVLGAAEAFVFVAALSAFSDMAPEGRRGEAISFFSLSLYLGLALGPFVGEAVLGDDRYALAWVTAAALSLVGAAFALRSAETLVVDATVGTGEPAEAPPRRRRLVHPGGLLTGAVLLTSTTGMGAVVAFGKLYADGLGIDSAPVFATLAGIVIGMRVAMPWLPDRLGARRAATIALTFIAIGMATVGLWPTVAGFYAGVALFAFGTAFAFPALAALTAQGVPAAERGAAMGTFSSALDLAFGVGPVLLGVVNETAGFAAMWMAAGAVAVAGLLLLGVTRERSARPAVA